MSRSKSYVLLAAGHSPAEAATHREEHELAVQMAWYTAGWIMSSARYRRSIEIIPVSPLGKLTYRIAEVNAWVRELGVENTFAIDLHFNAGPPEARGVEAFHYPYVGRGEGKILAASIVDHLANARMRNRGAKPDTRSGPRSLGWCRQIACPSVLVELGFLENSYDRTRYGTPLERAHMSMWLGDGIVNGVYDIYADRAERSRA